MFRTLGLGFSVRMNTSTLPKNLGKLI